MHTKLFLIYCNDVLHLDLDGALIALQPAVLAIPNWRFIPSYIGVYITSIFFVLKSIERKAMFSINLDAHCYKWVYT